MPNEHDIRTSKREAIERYFREHPGVWIGVHTLAHIGGFAAWRTRVSEARLLFESEGGSLTWNQSSLDSQYMYRPQAPLGRDASEPIQQKSLF